VDKLTSTAPWVAVIYYQAGYQSIIQVIKKHKLVKYITSLCFPRLSTEYATDYLN
jgi:hypothetical protein